jgi:catechol 2,3-dioxygenase-like lactoylglutathione lyase family enzyme
MTISVSSIHHFTIGCASGDLFELVAFYTKYVGLEDGPRPALRHPGHWLYSDGKPIVHLNALLAESGPRTTGAVDHISFRAHGLEQTRRFLEEDGIAFSEAPLFGTSLHQVFLRDPGGLKIELTFDTNAEG